MTLVYDISAGSKRLLRLGHQGHHQAVLRLVRPRTLRQDSLRLLGHVAGVHQRLAALLPSSLLILVRFHIVKKLKEAVDKTHRVESAVLRRKDKVTLGKTGWCLLKKKKFHTQAVQPTDSSDEAKLLPKHANTTDLPGKGIKSP